jgi:phage terminase large subunit-like protein
LTMCAGNAVTEIDAAANRKLSKQKATGRIDLILCAVMACGIINSTIGNNEITQGFVNI